MRAAMPRCRPASVAAAGRTWLRGRRRTAQFPKDSRFIIAAITRRVPTSNILNFSARQSIGRSIGSVTMKTATCVWTGVALSAGFVTTDDGASGMPTTQTFVLVDWRGWADVDYVGR